MEGRKVISTVLNGLTWIASCVSLGIGIWLLVNPRGVAGEFLTQVLPIVFISLAGVIGLLAVFGCYAAIVEDGTKMRTLLVALAFLVTANIIILVATFFFEYSVWLVFVGNGRDLMRRSPVRSRPRLFPRCGRNTTMTTLESWSMWRPRSVCCVSGKC